jgi:hypothetical protein
MDAYLHILTLLTNRLDFRLLLGMWQKHNVNVFNFFTSNHSSYSYLF